MLVVPGASLAFYRSYDGSWPPARQRRARTVLLGAPSLLFEHDPGVSGHEVYL